MSTASSVGYVLAHSPFVGPATWRPVAARLGDAVVVAGLTDDLRAELPRAPAAILAEPVPVPAGWMEARPCAYLQLSAAYDDEADRAVDASWPVLRWGGGHLDLVARPDQ